MKLELEDSEIRNLLIFLNRSNIQGGEALTLLNLMEKIQQQMEKMELPKLRPEESKEQK